MRLKYKVNIVRERLAIGVLSIILALLGLSFPFLLRIWLPVEKAELSLWPLIISAVLGIILAKYFHETYRYLITRFLNIKVYFLFLPFPKIYYIDGLTKWQAVSLALAPFVDLTIIGLIAFYFSPWLFIPLVVTFITLNFILSAKDLIEAYYLFKLVDRDDVVQKNPYGFEVWTTKNIKRL